MWQAPVRRANQGQCNGACNRNPQRRQPRPRRPDVVARGAPGRRSLLLSLPALSALVDYRAHAAYLDGEAAQYVYRTASRSVVCVEDYMQNGGALVSEGVGSGFVWDKKGHIVTNYHCVSKLATSKDGSQVTKVVLQRDSSEARFQATLVATDPSHDLAVLRIDAPPELLHPIRIGTSADLLVGQSVFAIGNPDGFATTQSAGVVSGLNRSIPSPTGIRIPGVVQTDASISAGNSGGPLLDSSARLVGVNTATFTKVGTGRGSGVNFALPVDMVFDVVPRLIVYGQASERRL